MKFFKERRYLITYVFIALLALAVIRFDQISGFLSSLIGALTPLFIGLVLAFVLNQPFKFFERLYRKAKRLNKGKRAANLAILSVYLILFGILVSIVLILIPQLRLSVSRLIGNSQRYSETILRWLAGLQDWMQRSRLDASSLQLDGNNLQNWLNTVVTEWLPNLLGWLSTLPAKVATTFIGLIISVYLLADKKRLLAQCRRVIQAYAPPAAVPRIHKTLSMSNEIFASFVVGQLVEALILGGMIFVGMALMGFDYALLIGVVIAVTALIPIVGGFIGGGIGFLILVFENPLRALGFLLYLIIIQQIEGNLIYPRTVGKKVGLPAIWVLLSISVGIGLGGIVGALIAVPTASVIYKLTRENVLRREALGEQSPDASVDQPE